MLHCCTYVGSLSLLPAGQGHGVWRLRSRRRQLVLTVQAELESLDVFLHDFSVGRSAMRKLNALLDGLCEKQPDFVCPITRDVMLRPVVASSGQTFEAVALREHCAGQRRRRGDVHAKCPVTKQALRPAEVRPGQGAAHVVCGGGRMCIAQHALGWHGPWTRSPCHPMGLKTRGIWLAPRQQPAWAEFHPQLLLHIIPAGAPQQGARGCHQFGCGGCNCWERSQRGGAGGHVGALVARCELRARHSAESSPRTERRGSCRTRLPRQLQD